MLISIEDQDLNKADSVGRSPLLVAARNGNLGALQLLYAHEKVDKHFCTKAHEDVLFMATYSGSKNCLHFLLDQGHCPFIYNNLGKSPLD